MQLDAGVQDYMRESMVREPTTQQHACDDRASEETSWVVQQTVNHCEYL
jgi:hypothetical protein